MYYFNAKEHVVYTNSGNSNGVLLVDIIVTFVALFYSMLV